jgi:sigma-B regulation protein RsbU (phosphoserine phosphatase)
MARDLQAHMRELRETTAAKERLEGELKVARDIQMSFLKKQFPAFPGRNDFSLFATIEPAREVGGDLYDFALLDQRRVVFCIGDVSDKGVPAALVMAETMTLMKQAAMQPGITAAGILRQVNAALAEGNQTAMFVTLFIGVLDVCTGEMTYSNAGHNPPLVIQADGQCRFLALPEGLVLGALTESEYRDETVRLESGEMLLAYTDGVTEAMSPAHALYSEARLQEMLTSLGGRDVESTVNAVVASVHAHAAGAPQSDDIAVIALRRS